MMFARVFRDTTRASLRRIRRSTSSTSIVNDGDGEGPRQKMSSVKISEVLKHKVRERM